MDETDRGDGFGEADAAAPGGDPFAAARAAAAARGGRAIDLPHHLLLHIPAPGAAPHCSAPSAPRAARRLVVTFDNLASVREAERWPWGYRFLEGQGWDVLGVMIRRKDWFRDEALHGALEGLAREGFFAGFGAVSAFGSSMGGFGALAFAPLYPGATILAFAPQVSLDPARAPFETRYRYARRMTDWSGRFADAAAGARAAGRVYLAHDPRLAQDAAHAAAIAGPDPAPNVTLLRMPFHGHKLPPALLRMGLLKDLAARALEGRLEAAQFSAALRARKTSVPYILGLAERAAAAGHPGLARRVARYGMRHAPNWKLRKLAAALGA